jgi:glycosyltransferase involved in cell wall biosynthesis
MRFVFASYVYTKEFNHPANWLKRINVYTGILEALSENNEVISIEQINYEGRQLNNGVDYRFLRFSPKALKYLPIKLHQYIKALKPDVVVIQGLHFPLQVIQMRLLLGSKVKIILQNHAEKPFNGIKKILQHITSRYVDAYLFASYPMGVEWVAKGNLTSAAKIHEVMEVSSVFYPADRTLARQKTHVTGYPVYLWVGRLNANKDPVTVLRAFLKFAAKYPDARLYMIYHTNELLNIIKALLATNKKQANTVKLIGKVNHADLLYWYNSADFILSGSHYEGSGTAVCEAMSCGCIPIVTDILSFRMITDNGKCGALYEAGNEKALLNALKHTGQMDMQATQKRTLDHFKQNLSFNAIATRIQQIATSL